MPRSALGNGFGLICSIGGIDPFSLNREKLPVFQHLSCFFWYLSSAFLLMWSRTVQRAEMMIFLGCKIHWNWSTRHKQTNKQSRNLLAFPLPCDVDMRKQENKVFFVSGKGWDLLLGKKLKAVNTNSWRIAADGVSRATSVIKGRLMQFGFVLTIYTTAQGRNLIY